MSPKEKAEELFKKMYTVHPNIYPSSAKQCVLVAVGEIIKQETERCLAYKETGCFVDFWQEVKQEIEKL